jgi:hypothetical protein
MPIDPVTAADVRAAVHLACDTLAGAVDRDWRVPAGELDWDCWETVEHIADDLFAYAGQLGPRKPSVEGPVPFGWDYRRPGGPALTIYAVPADGQAGLVQVLEASGALLAAMAEVTPPGVRAYHVYGASDPEGFAAMGVVEVLVHMRDVTAGLELPWERRGRCVPGSCTGCSRTLRPAPIAGRPCCGRRAASPCRIARVSPPGAGTAPHAEPALRPRRRSSTFLSTKELKVRR